MIRVIDVPSVSCIIPTFNRWDFLRYRLEELNLIIKESQGQFKLEIIVIDDCSTQYCPRSLIHKIFEMGGKYLRLQKNSGCVSIPRNIGIAHTVSEFIAHVDDDVILLPEKFKNLLSAFRPDIDLVYGAMYIEDLEGKREISYVKKWNPLSENGYGVDGSQFIYRRSVYSRIPLHFAKRGCDWELAKNIFNNNFLGVESPVSIYKWHGTNRSLDTSTKIKSIFPSHFSIYFKSWKGTIDYTPIEAI